MAIPEFSAFFLPVLTCAAKHEVCTLSELRAYCAEFFKLSDDDLAEKLNSGRIRRFDNRVQWAKTYLLKAGLLSSPKRGAAEITGAGKEILSTNPDSITLADLEKFPEFSQFHKTAKKKSASLSPDKPEAETISYHPQPPNERMEEILER